MAIVEYWSTQDRYYYYCYYYYTMPYYYSWMFNMITSQISRWESLEEVTGLQWIVIWIRQPLSQLRHKIQFLHNLCAPLFCTATVTRARVISRNLSGLRPHLLRRLTLVPDVRMCLRLSHHYRRNCHINPLNRATQSGSPWGP